MREKTFFFTHPHWMGNGSAMKGASRIWGGFIMIGAYKLSLIIFLTILDLRQFFLENFLVRCDQGK